MGLSFKENCTDLRNTRVIDIIDELKEYQCCVDVYDPWVSSTEAKIEYDISLLEYPNNNTYDAIIMAVGHQQFKDMGPQTIRAFGKMSHVIYDLKYIFAKNESDLRL